MNEILTTRRSAVVGMLAAVAALQTGGSFAQQNDATALTAADAAAADETIDKTRWGTEGTRDLLSSQLETFFGGASGSFVAVRAQDKNNLLPNGEYSLADQIRLPLYGVAAPKIVESDGSTIYQAFVSGNPFVRTFIKTDSSGNIEGVALADTHDITKNGTVIDIEPRLTVFFRDKSAPADLCAEAEKVMTTFWSREPAAPTMHDRRIKLVEHKLL